VYQVILMKYIVKMYLREQNVVPQETVVIKFVMLEVLLVQLVEVTSGIIAIVPQ